MMAAPITATDALRRPAEPVAAPREALLQRAEPVAAHRVALLQPAEPVATTLTSVSEGLATLFHDLACDASWFRCHGLPVIRLWAANSFLLAGGPGVGQPFALCQWLQLGACAARAVGQPPALQRLRAAHRVVMDVWWQRTRHVQLLDASGRCWPGVQVSVADWRAATPAPHQLVRLTPCLGDAPPTRLDPWREAGEVLMHRQVWSTQAAGGRWWHANGRWHLLWPLGGRDLLSTGTIQALDLGTGEPALQAVHQGLRHWGHLVPGETAPHRVARADGRLVTALAMRHPLFDPATC